MILNSKPSAYIRPEHVLAMTYTQNCVEQSLVNQFQATIRMDDRTTLVLDYDDQDKLRDDMISISFRSKGSV